MIHPSQFGTEISVTLTGQEWNTVLREIKDPAVRRHFDTLINQAVVEQTKNRAE